MKRISALLSALLIFSLLSACATQPQTQGSFTDPEPDIPAVTLPAVTPDDTDKIIGVHPPECAMFRIVDGAAQGSRLYTENSGHGSLLLAKADGGAGDVYRLNPYREGLEIYLDGKKADASALQDGMMIAVSWIDPIMETYPAQFGRVTLIEAWSIGSEQNPGGTYFDLCGLYLQVLDDLWKKDPALNDGKKIVSLDLSQAPGGLSESEKSALAWRFGELHDVTVLEMTFEELKEEGLLTEQVISEDKSFYSWPEGCIFSITPNENHANEVFSLPVVHFNAEKYVGPLAAYSFYDCSAVWPEMGTWDQYNIGGEVIA